jgi:hypothetical protein
LLLSALIFNAAARTKSRDGQPRALANPVAAQPLEQRPARASIARYFRRAVVLLRRRRCRCAGAAASAPPSAPPNVILLGVVMDGKTPAPLFKLARTKRLLRADGRRYRRWKVAQIDGRKVVLASRTRFVTYSLFNYERGGAGANGGAASDRPNNSQMQQAPSPTGGLELVQQTKPR